jgi:hypothetical protein
MKTTFIYCALIVLLFAGCRGKTGGTGATGSPGAQGPPGSLTVSSSSLTVNPAGWSQVSNSPGAYYVYYTDNDITDPATDIVECFVNNPNSTSTNTWVALPATSFDIKGDALGFSFSMASVTLYYYWNTVPNDPFIFHIVVIPPSIPRQYPHADLKDYNTVNALIQLQKQAAK